MPEFVGSYIKEPSDFATVTTEADLIQVADDPASPVVPEDTLSWAELVAGEKAALKAVIDPIIIRKEGIIDGYLRAGGYATPADIVRNPIIQDYAARLVWNDLRYRKKQLSDEEYRTANADILKELSQIGSGALVLAAAPSIDEDAPSGLVHAVKSSPRVFSRETLEEF